MSSVGSRSGLFGYRLLSSLELIIVEQVVVLEDVEVLVELVNERHRSGDIVLEDLILAHAIEHLNDGAQRVTMSNDNNVLVVEDLRADSVVPVRQDTVNSDFKRLSIRERAVRQVLVLGRESRVSFVIIIERRRRNVVASSPLKNLLLAMPRGRLGLVEALEGTVMTLVKSPVLVVRYPAFDPPRWPLRHRESREARRANR